MRKLMDKLGYVHKDDVVKMAANIEAACKIMIESAYQRGIENGKAKVLYQSYRNSYDETRVKEIDDFFASLGVKH